MNSIGKEIIMIERREKEKYMGVELMGYVLRQGEVFSNTPHAMLVLIVQY